MFGVQLSADVLGGGELVVQCRQFLFVFSGLCHVEAGGCLHIGQQMFALVVGDVFVHVSQLVLYHVQTVADELRGADGNLVLVLNPVLIINLDQGVQYVFRFPGGGIVDAEVDDGASSLPNSATSSLA